MKDMYLDPTTGDLALDANNNLRLTTTTTEWLSQKIENWLATQYGEWFLNREMGFQWYETVLKKGPDFPGIKELLITYISRVPGVNEVVSLDIEYSRETRLYEVVFTVRAESDEVISGLATI